MKRKHLKKVLAILLVLIGILAGGMSVSAQTNYPDVRPGDWHYSYVQYVTEQGIMTGYSNGYFGPADAVTRGQFATILYRMEGSPDIVYQWVAPDVPEDAFYTAPIIWANDSGVITGYSNGYFGPNDYVTREQIATILYRYSKAKGYDTSARDNLAGFPDSGNVSGFARDAVSWAVGTGLITGDRGYINPQGNTNRAEAAAIIQRYQQYTAGQASHQHTWKTETYTTEVQRVYVCDGFIESCGLEFLTNEELLNHIFETGHLNYHLEDRGGETVTKNICTGCGAIQ